jgi:hypothetical protein
MDLLKLDQNISDGLSFVVFSRRFTRNSCLRSNLAMVGILKI